MNSPSSYSYQTHLMSQAEGVHLGHIYEFSELSKRIAIETVNELVPSMVEDICSRVIKDYLNGNLNDSINYDINSIATVSIKDFNTIFKSEKFSSFMSHAITDEIRKRIDEIDFNIKL